MNLVPKSRLEKLGDFLSRPLHRFIFSVVTIIPFFVFAIFNILSVIPSVRVRFVANVMVPGKDGKMIPCAIVKSKYHAFMPIVPIVCFFFYVPYQVEYYLVENVSLPSLAPNSRISEGLLRICKKTRITSGTVALIQKNPALISDALEADLAQAKQAFHADIQPYIDAKVLRITEETDSYAVCRFPDDDVLICHYVSYQNMPLAACFSARELAYYQENPIALYETYASGKFRFISLNSKTLERLISICNNMQQENAPQETEKAVTPESLPESVNEHIENAKKPLTKEMVEKDLNFHASSGKKAGGYVFAFLSLFAVELAIAGFVFVIPMGIIFGIVSFFLIRATVRKFKTAKVNKEKLEKKQYRILKVKCIRSDVTTNESNDGDYTTYDMEFENGYKFSPPQHRGIAGDWFFLVYLDGVDQPVTMYNAVEYRAEPDLTVEIYKA